MYQHHFVSDIHTLKGRGEKGGKGAHNEKQYVFPLPDFYHSYNLQHSVQKDLAFDVNPMLFCLLLQALQHAIHFLAGKEMDVLHKVPVKSTVLRRPPWHVNSYRKARMVCNMATWGLHRTEAYCIWLSNLLALLSAVSKIHFRRCLPLSHSEKQKQKVYIGLSYLSPLYF